MSHINSKNTNDGSSISTTLEDELIYKRLPKVVSSVNQGKRHPSVTTPPPVPKNPERINQLQELMEPLGLSLTGVNPESCCIPSGANDQDTQSRIIQLLIQQSTDLFSKVHLNLKLEKLRTESDVMQFGLSPTQALQQAQRNFLKMKELEKFPQNDECPDNLTDIVEGITDLEASMKLKTKEWLFKPRHCNARDKILAERRTRLNSRKQLSSLNGPASSMASKLCSALTTVETISTNCTSGTNQVPDAFRDGVDSFNITNFSILKGRLNKSDEEIENEKSRTRMPPNFIPGNSSETETKSKKAVRTKAQLKHVPKSRVRVLVLPRNVKIRRYSLFRCRKTKEKFTFGTAHRTIRQSGLSLLTAAYAFRSKARFGKEGNQTTTPSYEICGKEPMRQFDAYLKTLNEPISMKDLLRMSKSNQSDSGEAHTIKEMGTATCYCEDWKTTGTKETLVHDTVASKPKDVIQRNVEPLPVARQTVVPPGGVFDHTIQLLAYERELKQTIHTLRTDGNFVKTSPRPELKIYPRTPLACISPSPTRHLKKSVLIKSINQAVCDHIAHRGFTHASLPVIEILSELWENKLMQLASSVKAIMEREAVGMSHGFLDPVDRVATDMGLGGVSGIMTYYRTQIQAYHDTVDRRIERLENKLGTLLAFKVRGNQLSGSTVSSTAARGTSNVGAGASNRNSKLSLSTNGREFQMRQETLSLSDSKEDSTEDDLLPNFQLDCLSSSFINPL